MSHEQTLARIGVRLADILLPRVDVDLSRWAVVACDQYTAQPDYWDAVEGFGGESPSTLRLIYPERSASSSTYETRRQLPGQSNRRGPASAASTCSSITPGSACAPSTRDS